MSALNNCVIVGRVYSEKIDVDKSGERPRAKFTMTVRRGQGKADFIPVTAWGTQAEFAEKYLEKGKCVAIRGEFRSDRVEGKDGVKWFYGITAYDINFLPETEGEGGSGGRSYGSRSGGGGSGKRYSSSDDYDDSPY